MYKYIVLLQRKTGLSHADFREYWANEHAPLAREIEGVRRYTQVIPTNPDAAEFDGLACVYFDELADLYAAFGGPGGRKPDPDREHARRTREDTVNFLDVDAIQQFIGEEFVQRDDVDGDTDGRYIHTAFLIRKPDMSHEDFIQYWRTEYTPIAREIDGVVRYATIQPVDPETASFDGVAELYFDSLDDLHDALGSPGSRDYDPTKEIAKRAREDVDNFLAIEKRPRLIGQEHVVVDQP